MKGDSVVQVGVFPKGCWARHEAHTNSRRAVLGLAASTVQSVATPQPGIFSVGTRSHHHVEFDLTGDVADLGARVRRIKAGIDTVTGVNLVVGFGPRVCAGLASADQPADFTAFEEVVGADGFTMPATQHDLWLWAHGNGADNVLDVVLAAAAELEGVASLAAEQVSFVYRSNQDMTGFEDGTENPPIDEAAEVASIPAGQPAAGGNIVLVQRWVHDLNGFGRLTGEEQEGVFGRTLVGSVELDDETQNPRSHVSRVVVEDAEGEELEVFRRSTAFGGVGEQGLVFVAFSRDQARVQTMLERMAGSGDGVRDRLTEFSTPTTGAWYFAPSVEALAAMD